MRQYSVKQLHTRCVKYVCEDKALKDLEKEIRFQKLHAPFLKFCSYF